MNLDLQGYALKKILQNQDVDLYSKVNRDFFTNFNVQIYAKIESFYSANQKIPKLNEFEILLKDISALDYYRKYILNNVALEVELEPWFVINQLEEEYIRNKTLDFLDDYVTRLPEMEKELIIEEMQDHLLELNKALPNSEELFDVSAIETFPIGQTFILYPSGLSNAFDAKNGGFAQSELVMIGGRRGSGKSILALNTLKHRFLTSNSTCGYFSIEMRYKEQYDRLMSSLSGVNFMQIYKNELTDIERLQLGLAKLDFFYEKTDEVEKLVSRLSETGNFIEFDAQLKKGVLPKKKNRFFIIDDSKMTISRIDHYCNMFKQKYPDTFTMIAVDYLNIIQATDRMNWQVQIGLADALKLIARKYEITVLTPYQTGADGEARFAKGVLDSADKSLIFLPADKEFDPTTIKMFTSKIRNGVEMNFDVTIDWDCIRVIPNGKEFKNKAPKDITNHYKDEPVEKSTDIVQELITLR